MFEIILLTTLVAQVELWVLCVCVGGGGLRLVSTGNVNDKIQI